jgi:hypothetical protein
LCDSTALQEEVMVTTVVVDKRPPPEDGAEPRQHTAEPRRAQPKQSRQNAPPSAELSDSERYHQISLCAYFRAEQRGFAPGHMWDDWLAAEREVAAKSALRASSERSDPKT